jgi:hypothetical protein
MLSHSTISIASTEWQKSFFFFFFKIAANKFKRLGFSGWFK